MKRLTVKDLAVTALFSAIIGILSQLIIPTPFGIPVTFQTFTIALTGYYLGTLKGCLSVIVYIALGTVGIPVFSGFRGGLGAVLDITGGFIIGFIPLVILCGIKTDKRLFRILFGFAGVILCHISGVLWFSVYSGDLLNSFFSVSLPFLLKDFISTAAAVFVSDKIKKAAYRYSG